MAPGKLSNRRARRKLLVDTDASERILTEVGMKFMMAIRDARTEGFTYKEIFHGYEREFTERIERINQFRSSSRLPLNPKAFRDTYGPLERDLSTDGIMEALRAKFINPLPIPIKEQTLHEEDPDQ